MRVHLGGLEGRLVRRGRCGLMMSPDAKLPPDPRNPTPALLIRPAPAPTTTAEQTVPSERRLRRTRPGEPRVLDDLDLARCFLFCARAAVFVLFLFPFLSVLLLL